MKQENNEKITKTFLELRSIDFQMNSLYMKNPKMENTKLAYAWKRFLEKNLTTIYKEFERKLQNIKLENALEDPKTKELLKDATGQYKYDKVGERNRIEQENALLDEYSDKPIEIEPYYATSVPEDLSEYYWELLKGLIIE